MHENIVDPLYNLQRTEQDGILTAIEVETARPLTLTQDAGKAGKPGYLFLAPTANVTIFGNEVTVPGKLEFPGRNVVIFARVLRAEPDGTIPPAISVNGADRTDNDKKDPAPQNFQGDEGDHGKNERAPDIYLPGEQTTNGGDGWSGPNHRDVMDGKPGDQGASGNAGGNIWICCEQCDFGGDERKLAITADGGRGGEGQQGQKGAKGGKGGDGADAVHFPTGVAVPTKGGGGGRGGDGGKGGQGGQGGKGGKIFFHCELVDAEPKLTLSYAGGQGGPPGKPGVGGDGGPKGIGGRGGDFGEEWALVGYARTKHYPNGPDGDDGKQGGDHGHGDPAPPSDAGEKSVSHGPLKSSSLESIARVSHTQMLFEQARADYLVTEPADYSVQLVVAMSETELPKIARNLIVVGYLRERLRIQIFDAKGKKVLDRKEEELLSQEAAAKFRERFAFRIDDVVLAGRWSAEKKLADLSADARHDLFLEELNQFSNGQADRDRTIEEMDDDELAGAEALTVFSREMGGDVNVLKASSVDDQRNGLISHLGARFGHNIDGLQAQSNPALVLLAKLHELTNGKADDHRTVAELSLFERIGAVALAVFLRETGIRGEQELKKSTSDDQRNALISELGWRCAYEIGQLQGLDNQRLVLLGLQRPAGLKIGESLSLLKDRLLVDEEEQEELVHNAGLCTRYVDPWTSVGDRLVWITKLLGAAGSSKMRDDSEKRFAALLYKPAIMALTNHRNGLDFFGRDEWYTPKLSFDTHEKFLTESLGSLKIIEDERDKYFTAFRDHKNAADSLSAVIRTTDSQIGVLSGRKAKLKEELNKTSGTIDEFDKKLNQDVVASKVAEFEVQIKSAFGLSWRTFFNCLGMLSFMNVNEPRNAINTLTKAGGYAAAGAMAASQVGAMIDEGVNAVLNDSGEPVPKNYVLTQIEVIKGDIRLQSEFKKRENGFLNADASKRLVVELDRFRGLCRQFYKSAPSAEKLRKDLDGFIETMMNRNAAIDAFNSILVEMRQLAGEVGALELQKSILQGNLTKISNPGLPVMANFVSGLYERAKATCISDLYKAFRAKAFWALEPYSGFYDLLGSSPDAITHAALEGYSNDLLAELEGSLENARAAPNIFPESKESMGAVIVLTPSSHEQFFKNLRDQFWAEFELEPATKASTDPSPSYSPTAAAWCGTERPIYAPDAPNPFHGKSNVRLTKVRTWMVGMKVGKKGDGAHSVKTTHSGTEQFRQKNNVPYPARTVPAGEPDLNKRNPEYVKHESTPIPFKYDPTNLRYDPTKPDNEAFTPGSLTSKSLTALMDGNLEFPSSGLAALPGKSAYAPIGPFTKWRVDVREEDNADLDLTGLTAVIIEMHGFCDTF